MRAVRMRRGYGLNNAGELCGFPDDEAARLVSAGLAVYVDVAPPAVTQSTPDPAPPEASVSVAVTSPDAPPMHKAVMSDDVKKKRK